MGRLQCDVRRMVVGGNDSCESFCSNEFRHQFIKFSKTHTHSPKINHSMQQRQFDIFTNKIGNSILKVSE